MDKNIINNKSMRELRMIDKVLTFIPEKGRDFVKNFFSSIGVDDN